ncbi:DMT family transporter [Bacillus sp. T33-2]|uniref:DMT family transporter n=1 Tax=Bacillus sp. T33-2 TaxID=2054168 RepID=UPI000C761B29|nr:EamA family transporter [Bacillus sp. T33-2]PLR92005.1 EamA family transporter [Bacillus sp. T33-2]
MVIINYLFMCLIFGTTFLAIKIGVDSGLPPFLSAGMRFFIAGLLLFVFMSWRRKTSIGLLFQKELFLTGLGLTFGTFATLYWAEQYVSSGVAAVLSATGPMMILVIQYLILKQKGNRVAFVGCLIGVIGVSFLILPSISLGTTSMWVAGCLVIIIGEVFYAAGAIYSKHVVNKFQNTHPIALNAAQMMMGGGLLIVLSFVMERGHFALNLNFMSLGSLLYLIVFGSMIGHSLFYWLVARMNPVFPSTWLFISPIIAVLLGHIVYHEAISWYTGIGTLTIITGTVLANFHSIRVLVKKKSLVMGR